MVLRWQMNGFWRTSIFTSGSGIKAELTAMTHSVKIAFHKKNLMLPRQRKGPRLHRVKNMPKATTASGKSGTPTYPPRKTWHFYYQLWHTHCELSFKELKSHRSMIGSRRGCLGRAAFHWLTVLSLRLPSSQWRCNSAELRCRGGSGGRVQPPQ